MRESPIYVCAPKERAQEREREREREKESVRARARESVTYLCVRA